MNDVLTAGRRALAKGREAEASLEEGLKAAPTPELWEGLSWAGWWLEDVAACLNARDHAYRCTAILATRAGRRGMALWIGDDHIEFRRAKLSPRAGVGGRPIFWTPSTRHQSTVG